MEQIKNELLSAYKWRHACKEFDKNKKITQEDFQRILNIGFCFHSNGTLSFRCYSDWCNFKAKSKEKFLNHIRDHHRINSEFKKYNYCYLCQVSILTKNREEEF